MLDRRTSAAIIIGVAAASVAVDQVTKTVAQNALHDGHSVWLVFGMRFVLTYNSGAAFSVGAGRSGVFTVLASITITVLLAYALWVRQRPLQAVAFALILGGAAGNLTDRLARSNGGRVIDFLELAKWWPVINFADASLFCGVALLLLLSLRDESRRT
jgi:signal peptidase II